MIMSKFNIIWSTQDIKPFSVGLALSQWTCNTTLMPRICTHIVRAIDGDAPKGGRVSKGLYDSV